MNRRIGALSFSAIITAIAIGPAHALTPDEKQCVSFRNVDYSRCIVTRDYVSKAKAVVAKRLKAELMPDKPKSFDVRYVSAHDKDIINEAVKESIAAMIAKSLSH